MFAAMFSVMMRLVATALAPMRRASRGMNPNVSAQTPNWQRAFVKEGTRTSRLRKIARTDPAVTCPRLPVFRGIFTHATMMLAAIERPAAAKNEQLAPPRVSRKPVRLVPIIWPMEEAKDSREVAKIVRSDGKKPAKTTIMGTQAAAATPVSARPKASMPSDFPSAMTTAPIPAKSTPPTRYGLLRPVASVRTPSGIRSTAIHRPYMERTTPTAARLDVRSAT